MPTARAWLAMMPAHGRRVEAADPAGAQAEAREGVGDVVFAAADPDFERRGELDPPVLRRREPNHALAEGDQIELTIVRRFHLQGHYCLAPEPGF